MKIHEILNNINNKLLNHSDYNKAMISYYQAEMVNEHYATETNKYYPGHWLVPREERDKYRNLIKSCTNRSIFFVELMKSLLSEAERKDDHEVCIQIFSRSINILKKQLSNYKGQDRILFAHDIFCYLEIPYINLDQYDPDGFLSKVFNIHVRKIRNMARQQIHDNLSEYYYVAISKLDTKVFTEEEKLPAAIILDAYEESDMKGMKNARYFSTVVANELGEIIDDNTTAEIVKKLITQKQINGQIDGKYHFLLCD